jgi:hypothetical protein
MNKTIKLSEAISCEKWWINHSSELRDKLDASEAEVARLRRALVVVAEVASDTQKHLENVSKKLAVYTQ